jgi:precorrin-2 dehydrogenase/sirohydrochlorin ferrochelatase
MTFIPLYVDVSTLKVLVIGGGKVGTKRALKLLDAGATVTVLSKDFTPQLLESRARLIKVAWTITPLRNST